MCIHIQIEVSEEKVISVKIVEKFIRISNLHVVLLNHDSRKKKIPCHCTDPYSW